MAGILDALASYIQNMLTEMAKEEVHMLLGVSGEIDNMGNKLRDLKNFLADADRRNITDHSVQAFVRELRDAMYDATDILDLCQLKAMDQGPRHDAGCFNPLLFCIRNPLHAHNIGSRIKNLNKKLDGIKARSESFNFINLGTYEDRGRKMVSSSLGTHETSWGLDETGLVGEMIEEDTQNLVELLTKKDQTHRLYNKIMVFAIVGVGGIGKTTLARKIFKNDIVQQEFLKKIWLSVNQDFNELDILRRAITEAGGDYHVAGDTKATLERILTQALMGHKTLIIMDDVWDYHAWEDVLRTPLVNVAAADNGSRVLVTTRHNAVARGMMAEQPYHRIRKLEPEDAWLLLKKQVGQCSNAVLTEAEVFWRTVLPDSPLPDPILKLLHPETSFENKPKDDTVPEAYSLTWLMWGLRSPSGLTKHSSPRPSKDDTVAEAYSLTWLMWGLRSPSGPTKHSSPGQSRERDHSTDEYLAQGLFFHEEAVQVGKTITLYFPLAASAPLGLLPRHVADSIPFSTSSLPSALARLGVARNSMQAANMEETLYMCGLPPKAGEAKFCATSLEALVEGTMAALGTRNIRPMTSDLPRSGAPKQPYTVRAVHPVDGSSFVSCHDHDYPYTVYMCHNTPSTRAYMVELEGARSGLVVTVAAICHTDTAHWDSEHFSFKVLGTKPGGAPICHYLPYGHNVWVKKEANRSSS